MNSDEMAAVLRSVAESIRGPIGGLVCGNPLAIVQAPIYLPRATDRPLTLWVQFEPHHWAVRVLCEDAYLVLDLEEGRAGHINMHALAFWLAECKLIDLGTRDRILDGDRYTRVIYDIPEQPEK